LEVTLSPAQAVAAGAQWRVDEGTWQNSGAVVPSLSVGAHTVTFSPLPGWLAPVTQTVTVTPGATSTAAALYLPDVGSLQVTITPAGAVAAGAQWHVDGGTWQSSGAMVTGVSAGSHTISFSIVNGWAAPPAQEVTISAGGTVAATGIYVQQVAPAQVVLAFNVEGKNLVLSWSTNLTGFELQSATNLRAWASVPLAPAVCGTNYVVTNAIAGGSSFFRLKK